MSEMRSAHFLLLSAFSLILCAAEPGSIYNLVTLSGSDRGLIPSGDGGPATSASIGFPVSLALDRFGNLYIRESGRVRKVTHTGLITSVAGGQLGNGSIGIA